jgi:hypothetical protein
MQRSNPVGRWFSVIANLPIIGQPSHREQLILNRAQVLILDRVAVPDTARRQAPRADPATTRSAASATVSMYRWYARLRTPGPGGVASDGPFFVSVASNEWEQSSMWSPSR